MASSGATPIGYDDRGTGPALVLLHPFPLTRATWAGWPTRSPRTAA